MRLTKQVFSQDPHCCAALASTPHLTLTLHDGGGGWYVVLDAVEWAMDSTADIDALTASLRLALGEAYLATEVDKRKEEGKP